MKRKILTALLALTLVFTISAQDKKVNFGLQAGYSYNMPKETTAAINLNGFHVGPIISYNINETLGIQTGLLYNYFTNKRVLDSESIKATGTWRQNNTKAQYIDLPLRFQYSISLADDFYIRLLAGPNFNYGLNKQFFFERYAENKLQSGYPQLMLDYYKSANYSRFDLQFGIGVAVQYYSFSIRAGYDWGLLDRDKTTNSFKANDIKLGIAYTF